MKEPVQKGVIEDYDDFMHIIDHIMNFELKTGLEDSRVMITEPPNNAMDNREKLAEIMFEEFNVKALYFAG